MTGRTRPASWASWSADQRSAPVCGHEVVNATRPGDPIETDVLVVGAGPVGLFQIFQLGLHELRSQLIDSLPMLGGQCIELYPDKPLYDVPGLPACTGRELIDRLVQQIRPFATQPHLAQEVE